jgi:PAS domain S-box-containing protein
MQKSYFVLVLLLLFGLSQISFTQDIQIRENFRHYTNADGLSNQVVRSIKQDNYGFLWFGTEDGVNKYDGYDFKIYRFDKDDPKSLPDNFTYCLFPTVDGGMLVGTNNGGFAKYNVATDNFTSYRNDPDNSNSLSNNRVMAIIEDNEGNYWIGTNGGGLNYYNLQTDSFTVYRNNPEDKQSLSSDNVMGLAQDSKGYIWVRTFDGISRLDPGNNTFSHFELPGTASDDGFNENFYIDEQDVIWFGWNNNLVKMNTRTANLEFVQIRNLEQPLNMVSGMAAHDEENIWVGTYGGIHLVNKKTYKAISFYSDPENPKSLPGGFANAIYKDRSGSLWCVGLAKLNLNTKKFELFTMQAGNPNSLSGNQVRAMMVDSEGKYWVSVMSHLDIIDPLTKIVESYVADANDPDAVFKSMPSCFLERSNGDIWIGTWGSGIVIAPNGDLDNTYTIRAESGVSGKLQDDIIQALFEDSHGNIWVGSESGLDIYNIEENIFRRFESEPDNPNSLTQYGVQSNCILEDIYGNMWVGTWGGLTRMTMEDPKKGTFYSDYIFKRYESDPNDPSTLSDSRTISIMYDKENHPNIVFQGSFGGGINLVKFSQESDTDTIESYTTNDGLPNNVIYGMLADNAGNIWMSTNDGLGKFNYKAKEFDIYDVNDGLQDNSFYWGAYARGHNNELLFGGIKGFNVFDPDEIENDKLEPEVVITDFRIFNKTVLPGQKVNKNIILEKPINDTKEITLSYRENVFSFTFAALHYAYPIDNEYMYKMEGFDEQWIEVDSKIRMATYTNLNPGMYTFYVKASNYDGTWTTEPYRLTIKITPPWWKTWVFYILLFTLITVGVIYFIRQREEQAKRDKAMLQKKIKEGESVISEKMKQVEEQQELIKKRDLQEKEMRFISDGIAKFSDIITKHSNDLDDLSQKVISELVSYVGGCMGGLFLLNDDKKDDLYLELKGAFAPDEKMVSNEKFSIGEGYVGACYADSETITLSNVPDDYTRLSSGLGNSKPSKFYFVPLKQNETKEGVIEIGSFTELEPYKIEFIEKVSENITSVITIRKAKNAADLMVERSNMQSEELQAQEEEMRQNLEELMATQEELQRQAAKTDEMTKTMRQQATLLNTVLEQLPDYLYFKDKDSKFLAISKSMLPLFPYDKLEDMKGKSDFDFHPEEKATEFYNEEMEIIRTQKGFVDKIDHQETSNGVEQWMSVTKLPLIDEKGKVIGTFGISKDITELKKLEMQAKQKNEELQTAEEELRQNLEEMQTTQEQMKNQLKDNKDLNKTLKIEKALLDSLLNLLPDYIYFKDKDSKFIKVSKSMLPLFPYDNLEDMIGKSDFDFHPEDKAKEFFNEEMQIMNSRKGFVDKIDHQKTNTGVDQWMAVTKLPLLDERGRAIGTFGISKDITKIKQLELEAKKKTEELKAAEEELRQNLEEMKAIQEGQTESETDLLKQIAKLKEEKAELEKQLKDMK